MKSDLAQFEFVHQKLRDLLLWLEGATGFEFIETSIFRMNDPGVHGQLPCRGIDLRCHNIEVGKAVRDLINNHWEYDPGRPHMECCILHGSGWNMHLHTQVHNDTRRR